MCGFSGLVNFKSKLLNPNVIKAMCDVIAHRGPDDSGYLFFGFDPNAQESQSRSFTDTEFSHQNQLPRLEESQTSGILTQSVWQAVLGHRRLSILDLTKEGHQPMTNQNRSLWIAYNGEIYNYRELREKLKANGVQFRSQTDTEVVLKLWEQKGPQCLNDLNGMFAFAILDSNNKRLYLARDRFGVKPLYYYLDDEFLIFSSEIKGILASGLVEAKIDQPTLLEYFTFQNTFTNRTLFDQINILPPAHFLTIDLEKPSSIKDKTYWQLSFVANEETFNGAREEVTKVFSNAVRRQLVSDVPVGSFLSGGMDSGSIVAIASKVLLHMATFTLGFDLRNVSGIEQGFDERAMSESLSNLLQTEHYEAVLHAGDVPKAMEQLTWHMDDPRVGMCHPNWYASKLASRFVKVCLSGTGGDELFGGYPWRYQFSQIRSSDEFDSFYFNYWHRLLPKNELIGLFQPDLLSKLDVVQNRFHAVFGEAPRWNVKLDPQSNFLNRALYFEMRTFLHGLLIVEDRMSMAHSMETRVPFLDYELVDLALSIPPKYKLELNKNRLNGTEGKTILRKAMENILPPEYVHQKKQGFSPPDENWYRGPSMDYIKEILLDSQTTQRPFFKADIVAKRLQEHFEGKRNNRLLIWSLLCFEWLQRHFCDQSIGGRQYFDRTATIEAGI